MAFTRQHYVKIAGILADAHKDAKDRKQMRFGTQPMLDRMTERFITLFTEDNEQFDSDRFWNAADPV